MIMMYAGVALKNPNPNAKPARNVEIELMIEYILAITNQEIQ